MASKKNRSQGGSKFKAEGNPNFREQDRQLTKSSSREEKMLGQSTRQADSDKLQTAAEHRQKPETDMPIKPMIQPKKQEEPEPESQLAEESFPQSDSSEHFQAAQATQVEPEQTPIPFETHNFSEPTVATTATESKVESNAESTQHRSFENFYEKYETYEQSDSGFRQASQKAETHSPSASQESKFTQASNSQSRFADTVQDSNSAQHFSDRKVDAAASHSNFERQTEPSNIHAASKKQAEQPESQMASEVFPQTSHRETAQTATFFASESTASPMEDKHFSHISTDSMGSGTETTHMENSNHQGYSNRLEPYRTYENYEALHESVEAPIAKQAKPQESRAEGHSGFYDARGFSMAQSESRLTEGTQKTNIPQQKSGNHKLETAAQGRQETTFVPQAELSRNRTEKETKSTAEVFPQTNFSEHRTSEHPAVAPIAPENGSASHSHRSFENFYEKYERYEKADTSVSGQHTASQGSYSKTKTHPVTPEQTTFRTQSRLADKTPETGATGRVSERKSASAQTAKPELPLQKSRSARQPQVELQTGESHISPYAFENRQEIHHFAETPVAKSIAQSDSAFAFSPVSRRNVKNTNASYSIQSGFGNVQEKKQSLYSHHLDKKMVRQQSKFQRYSGREKQLQLIFQKSETESGKLHTKARIGWGEKQDAYETRGVIHKLANQKYRLSGDVPSLKQFQPTHFTGKAVKGAAYAGLGMTKFTVGAAKLGETAVLFTKDKVRQKNKSRYSAILEREEQKHLHTQHQLHLERKQGEDGKFHTTISVVKGVRDDRKVSNKGILHTLVNQKYRLTGDVPSFNKAINTKLQKWQPTTMRGMTAKSLIRFSKWTLFGTAHAAVQAGLAAETGAINAATTGTKLAAKTGSRKMIQKYRREAIDDAHRGTIAALQIGFDAGKGLRNHFKEKKNKKLQKARFRLQQYSAKEIKLQKQPILKTNKRDIKAKKVLKRINKLSYQKEKQKLALKRTKYESSGKGMETLNRIQKRKKKQYKEQKAKYKLELKQLKNQRNQQKLELKFHKKNVKNLRWAAILATPMPIALKPGRYTIKRITASGYQKAINADQNNDFVKLADEIKRHGLDKAKAQLKPSKLAQRNQKKNSKLQDKRQKKETKLKKQESRLKAKQKKQKKKSTVKKQKQSIGKKIKQFVKNVYEKEAKIFLGSLLFPVLIILLVFTLLLTMCTSIFTQSGFTLGTYTAQDFDLSEAVEYYTMLGYDLNQKVCKLKNSNKLTWKANLTLLDPSFVISGSWRETAENLTKHAPSEYRCGRSAAFDYDPVWDFDEWKLYSFLCAYYYDFSTDSSGTSDIKFWKFRNETQQLLDEIFEEEYEFEYKYENGSHWEELWDYNFATADGSRFLCSTNSLIGFGNGKVYGTIVPVGSGGSLSSYMYNGDTIIYDLSNLEVLNANDDFSATGWYILDEGATITSPCNDARSGLYVWDNYQGWGYTDITGTFQTHDSQWFSWTLGSTKLSDTPFASIAASDAAKMGYNVLPNGLFTYYQKYEWKNECVLSYNIKQKKTFEEILLEKLRSNGYGDQRVEYYNLLMGTDGSTTEPLYGNHQTYKNVLSGDSLKSYMNNGKIINYYGYDMQGWFNQHCTIATTTNYYDNYLAIFGPIEAVAGLVAYTITGLHHGLDISYARNSPIYSPLDDCEIKKYDSSTHVVVLRAESVNYWYEGKSGNGKKRDTEIYLTNVKLKDGYSEGSVLSAGEEFAVSTYDQNCILEKDTGETVRNTSKGDYVHISVYIDSDGFGWSYVDPLLLFY